MLNGWLLLLIAATCGVFVLLLILAWAKHQGAVAPVSYLRGPSLRYSAADDGSPEWLAEYFARLEGEA